MNLINEGFFTRQFAKLALITRGLLSKDFLRNYIERREFNKSIDPNEKKVINGATKKAFKIGIDLLDYIIWFVFTTKSNGSLFKPIKSVGLPTKPEHFPGMQHDLVKYGSITNHFKHLYGYSFEDGFNEIESSLTLVNSKYNNHHLTKDIQSIKDLISLIIKIDNDFFETIEDNKQMQIKFDLLAQEIKRSFGEMNKEKALESLDRMMDITNSFDEPRITYNTDIILDKIHKYGVNSLTDGEKQYLDGLKESKLKLSSLLLEYSDKIIQQLQTKFEKEGATLEESGYYIHRFEEIKESLPTDQRDIFKYTFKQLEKLIDSLPEKIEKVERTPENAVYAKNNLEIYRGDTRDKCISYGAGQKWCISRKGSNMFYSYRLNNGKIFYFVYDKSLPDSDPKSGLVVHVSINNNGDRIYSLSDKTNTNEKSNITWDQIVKVQPKLQGLENLFQWKQFTSNEDEMRKVRYRVSEPNLMNHFGRRATVEAYVAKHYLSNIQYSNLPDELRRINITQVGNLSYGQYIMSNDSLKNLYKQTLIRKGQEPQYGGVNVSDDVCRIPSLHSYTPFDVFSAVMYKKFNRCDRVDINLDHINLNDGSNFEQFFFMCARHINGIIFHGKQKQMERFMPKNINTQYINKFLYDTTIQFSLRTLFELYSYDYLMKEHRDIFLQILEKFRTQPIEKFNQYREVFPVNVWKKLPEDMKKDFANKYGVMRRDKDYNLQVALPQPHIYRSMDRKHKITFLKMMLAKWGGVIRWIAEGFDKPSHVFVNNYLIDHNIPITLEQQYLDATPQQKPYLIYTVKYWLKKKPNNRGLQKMYNFLRTQPEFNQPLPNL